MASLIVNIEVYDLETAKAKGVPVEARYSVTGTSREQWVTAVRLLRAVANSLERKTPEEERDE